MSLVEILSLITCVASCVTMTVVCVALLPQMKQGLSLIRDAVLWMALVLVVAVLVLTGVAWLGIFDGAAAQDGGPPAAAQPAASATLPGP